jgi:hypothetical protein
MPRLQARLDEFKKAFESGAPPCNAPHKAIETMHSATAELKASRLEDRALKVGDRGPSFTLINQNHVLVALAHPHERRMRSAHQGAVKLRLPLVNDLAKLVQ